MIDLRLSRAVLALMLAALVLASCGRSTDLTEQLATPAATSPAPTATPLPLNSRLLQALALVPAQMVNGDFDLGFTDWELIKQYEGVPHLNSDSPPEERMAFLRSTGEDQAAMSFHGLGWVPVQAERWRWDTTDLTWEVHIAGQRGAHTWILRLRDDFELSPVVELFEQRDFARQDYAGAAIYSHELDTSVNWLGPAFEMLNTAILDDEKLLVLSSSAESVRAVLDARLQAAGPGTLLADEGMRAVAGRLGIVAAAYLQPAGRGCLITGFNKKMVDDMRSGKWTAGISPTYQAMLDAQAKVHQYDGIGLGYRYEDGVPIHLLALHYQDPAHATADMEPRRFLATEAVSLYSHQTYSASRFTLLELMVEDSDLVFRLRQLQDRPSVLFNQLSEVRDMAFLVCPF